MATHVPSSCVESLVRDCRRRLLSGLGAAPHGDRLVPYFARGKMLRAELALLAAGAVAGTPSHGMGGAIAIEILHGASLIHDDIIDEASERRGLPALHCQVGTSVAIAVGDYLVLHAFAALGGACRNQPSDRVVRALETLACWGKECCRGEVLELRAGGASQSREAYDALTRGKTGSLFAAAATLGGLLAGGTPAEISALGALGLSVGAAYQIDDDLADDPEISPALVLDVRSSHLAAARNALATLRPSMYADALQEFIVRRPGEAVTESAVTGRRA
jgi:geranylgeranyl diphosphate synthase type I